MDEEQKYLELRRKLVFEKMQAAKLLLGEWDADVYVLTLWRMQYWRAKTRYLQARIRHGCVDLDHCGQCRDPWDKFLACQADCYETTTT